MLGQNVSKNMDRTLKWFASLYGIYQTIRDPKIEKFVESIGKSLISKLRNIDGQGRFENLTQFLNEIKRNAKEILGNLPENDHKFDQNNTIFEIAMDEGKIIFETIEKCKIGQPKIVDKNCENFVGKMRQFIMNFVAMPSCNCQSIIINNNNFIIKMIKNNFTKYVTICLDFID